MSHRRELALLVGIPLALGLLVAFWQTIFAAGALAGTSVWLFRRAFPPRQPGQLPKWIESFAFLSGASTYRRHVRHLEREETW